LFSNKSTSEDLQLEVCLKHIFAKYCTPAASKASDATTLLVPPPDAYLSEEGLQKWALATNGEPFSDETKEEMVEFFDITDDGFLTFVRLTLYLVFLLTVIIVGSKDSCNCISYRPSLMRKRLGKIWCVISCISIIELMRFFFSSSDKAWL
jgi:hypothetical protein